jgi:hypothetical protein
MKRHLLLVLGCTVSLAFTSLAPAQPVNGTGCPGAPAIAGPDTIRIGVPATFNCPPLGTPTCCPLGSPVGIALGNPASVPIPPPAGCPPGPCVLATTTVFLPGMTTITITPPASCLGWAFHIQCACFHGPLSCIALSQARLVTVVS